MEPNYGTPTGCGRGRPAVVNELRRPINNPTYAEFVPAEGANTNGMLADYQCHDQPREANYFASPSGDHARSYESPLPIEKEKKTFKLSPYAKEFIPRNFKPETEDADQPATESDSLPVIQLRSFLNEITMSPGKFERKINPLIHTLNSSVDDDDTMRCIVNIIFEESVRQPNLRYSGARLCKSLCTGLDPSSNHSSFKDVLLKRCEQDFMKYRYHTITADFSTYLRGFGMFMAELYSQLDVTPQKIPLLGDNLPKLIQKIISFHSVENIKCGCQILKLVGAYLEDYERSNTGATPVMDTIMCTLKAVVYRETSNRSEKEMVASVIKLRENDWGRSPHTENTGYDTPPPASVDEPVMYGPDGKPMTPEELMFLQSQYASNFPLEAEDYDLYDDTLGDEMPEEITEAYETFLRENGLRH